MLDEPTHIHFRMLTYTQLSVCERQIVLRKTRICCERHDLLRKLRKTVYAANVAKDAKDVMPSAGSLIQTSANPVPHPGTGQTSPA